jgi:short-subunit dehydrogenase
MSSRTVLITGASSGIGDAFAEVFAARGFDVVLAARREDRLRALAERLRARYGVQAHVIPSDLAAPEAVARLCGELDTRGIIVDALVNNAGYGVPGTFLVPRWAQHAAQMQVMMTALVELTYRLLPGMIARRYGRVINVASLAGLVPAPGGHTLYAACKAFVIRFSESLGHEVAGDGVHVTALCPGFTMSEFHDRTGTRDKVSRLPSWLWMDAETVARQGYEAVMAGRSVHVNGRVNRVIAAGASWLPHRLVTFISRRAARLYRKG